MAGKTGAVLVKTQLNKHLYYGIYIAYMELDYFTLIRNDAIIPQR